MANVRHCMAAFMALMLSACGASAIAPGAALPPAMEPVPEHTQHATTIHEAAHAVAIAVSFGPESVLSIHVHTERCAVYDEERCCSDPLGRNHFGTLDPDTDTIWTNARHHRNMLLMYLAGPAAGTWLADGRRLDDIDDELAEERAAMYARSRLPRLFIKGVVFQRGSLDAKRGRLQREILAQTKKDAERFVLEHAASIRCIAAAIEAKKVTDGKKMLTGDEFKALIEGRCRPR